LLWETRGSRLPLRGVIRLGIGIGSLWNLDGLLREYANRKNVIVLGIQLGGVPVAFEVARTLKAPLDVLVLRRLGVRKLVRICGGISR
jgi:orotate phosphoribosyltransferase-like protein